jgi:membrane protein implicated in regulation of membrane protease activity
MGSKGASLIVWGLLVLVGFFMMLGFYAGLNGVIPSSNPYGLWLPVLIFLIYVIMVTMGFSKAKQGHFFD